MSRYRKSWTQVLQEVRESKEEIDELVAPGQKSHTGYELYHKDFSSAMQHAYKFAKSKGHVIDPKEIDDKVATGPKKPSSGKTNRYSLKAGRKKVEIQVANLDNKRYELNMYIEGALTRIRSLVKKPEEIENIEEKFISQSDYFPIVLTKGIRKAIPGVNLVKHSIERPASGEKIPGLGLQLPGEKWVRIMVQYEKDTEPPSKSYGSGVKIVDIDPKTGKKEVTDTNAGQIGFNVWVNEVGKVWKKDTKDWVQSKDFRDPKKVVQFLKTKVKRMQKEEVEITEALKPVDKKVIDAFYKENRLSGKVLSSTGKSLEKHGVGGQTIAAWLDGKIAITAVSDVKSTEEILRYMKKSIPKLNFDQKSYKKFFEGIDIEKASMGAVIKDFQDSDAPQFKGKSDKKRKEMAIAAKLSKEEKEETDDPKSKKKDKINLKPKMDETMKNYKEFMKNVKEKRFQNEDTDKDTPGTQGDKEKWLKARAEVLKKFGVGSCSALKDEKEKKACFKALDDAHVADHEEQVKKEVKEAVTTGGIEYGEQDWDVQHRLEKTAPYMDSNFAEFHEQGLEGPYLWHGETYFFDRKVGGWYSVTAEDYVDDEISKDLSLAYVKDGMYKRQFAS